ncbi:hypothetical protein [Mycobacterium heckeshornense]|uniref:hypothetical protein n=1 Tax=Mycobacterium heckeshornense TaxID=110505 RepID=UPI000AFCAD48|nr:hypothetical protein [Mycobacterium heckeshornense]MCV7035485.1 hypothetical protein [Mycobacterium heckeshornense]
MTATTAPQSPGTGIIRTHPADVPGIAARLGAAQREWDQLGAEGSWSRRQSRQTC